MCMVDDDVEAAADGPSWIACRGRTRTVVNGEVDCPPGILAAWTKCLECRYLEAAEDDRHPERGCSIDAWRATGSHPVRPSTS